MSRATFPPRGHRMVLVRVTWDFDGLFDPNKVGGYFEGFPAERLFGPYKSNPQAFSFEVGGRYDVFTTVFLIARQFPAAKQ